MAGWLWFISVVAILLPGVVAAWRGYDSARRRSVTLWSGSSRTGFLLGVSPGSELAHRLLNEPQVSVSVGGAPLRGGTDEAATDPQPPASAKDPVSVFDELNEPRVSASVGGAPHRGSMDEAATDPQTPAPTKEPVGVFDGTGFHSREASAGARQP